MICWVSLEFQFDYCIKEVWLGGQRASEHPKIACQHQITSKADYIKDEKGYA